MAERIIHYPKVNPIQFVKVSDPDVLTKYNFRYWDEWWQCERKTPWEGKVVYYQKHQQNQSFAFQFHSNNNGEPGTTVQVYDMDWNPVVTVGVADTTVVGWQVVSEVSGTAYAATTHSASGYWGTMGIPDGKYIMVIEVPFAGASPVYMISEPIYLRDQHKNTKLIEFSNTVNNFDVFFKTDNVNYTLRVESHLYGLMPQSVDTQYEDELVDSTNLDSVPYNTATYGVRGVPEWMIDKVNRALSCDLVKIEGRYWVKDKDAKWEINVNPHHGKRSASISVRPAKNRFSQQVVDVEPILVWQVLRNGDSDNSTVFPFFAHTARMDNNGLQIPLMVDLNGTNMIGAYSTDCKEVRDYADALVLLNHANSSTKLDYNQQGYYYLSGDGITTDLALMYQPDASEQNYNVSTYIILSRHLTIEFEAGAYGSGQFYDVQGSYIGYALVRQNGSHANAKYGNGNPMITHLVGGSSINLIGNTARLYHHHQSTGANTCTRFIANYPTQTPNIQAFSNRMPRTLTHFAIRTGSAGSFSVMDWAIFIHCQQTIYSIEAYDNQIFAQGNLSTYAGQLLAVLQYIDLSTNILPATGLNGVDAFFNAMWGGGGAGRVYGVTGVGIQAVTTYLQSPAAVPTPTSAAARTGIGADGWNITTD